MLPETILLNYWHDQSITKNHRDLISILLSVANLVIDSK